MYLYGKNSVLERLENSPQTIKKIFIQDNFSASHILDITKERRVPVKEVSEKGLERIKRADRLQGIVALVEDFSYTAFDEMLNSKRLRGNTLIFLDNINDPHNLGSIIRIAACFGGFGIVIPAHRSCEVNDTVMHVASGGENFVPVGKVENISNALIKAKRAGYWVLGAVVENGTDISKAEFPFPLCLVMGSEGKGIRHGVTKRLDMKVSLPMAGAKLSLNVAMATAIFCHEIAKVAPTKGGG